MANHPHASTTRWLGPGLSLASRVARDVRSARFGRLSREFGWIVLGQLLAAAGCVFGVRMVTSVMTPESYGELALAMTAVTLAQHVLTSPLAVTAQRFYASALEENDVAGYLSGLYFLVTRGGAWLSLIALMIGALVLAGVGYQGVLVVLASAMLAVMIGLASILDAIHNAARCRLTVAWQQAASQWIRWGGAALAVVALGSRASAALLGSCCGLALMLWPRYWFFSRHVRPASRGSSGRPTMIPWRGRLQDYLWPFAAWGFVTWAMSSSDRWALGLVGATDSVGHYAVLFQLGFFPCVMLADTLTQFLAPILFQRAGDGSDSERQRRVLRLNRTLVVVAGWLLGLATLASWAWSDIIMSLLAGPAFRVHSDLLPWMMAAGSLYALGQVAALGILSGGHSRRLLPVKIGSSAAGIAANFAGAWLWGLPGVIVGVLIGSTAHLAGTLCVSRRLGLEVQSRIDSIDPIPRNSAIVGGPVDCLPPGSR